MPNYKTHSIHGEIIYNKINKKTDIDKEDIKTFCIGPDSLILTDYKTFNYQHCNKTTEYFKTILNFIKKNNLQDNSEVMAFTYAQIDHFILDIITHPLIYYMTEKKNNKLRINFHALTEMWLDDYVIKKNNIKDNNYYKKKTIKEKKLANTINRVYKKVYNIDFPAVKYNLGIKSIILFDKIIRKNGIKIAPILLKKLNLGDITYQENLDRVIPYLNLKKNNWYNPETNEEYKESFDELWEKSINISLETINDINNYLYNDKPITNSYLTKNISYNTGLPCEIPQQLKYVKKY